MYLFVGIAAAVIHAVAEQMARDAQGRHIGTLAIAGMMWGTGETDGGQRNTNELGKTVEDRGEYRHIHRRTVKMNLN
jgi:hypothetical protein